MARQSKSRLRVRVYNVKFGDAVLVTVPDRDKSGKETRRHILIDVGNSLNKAGGMDIVFKPVIEDIKQVIGKNPLDLYVMTHEHLDHIQGLPYAEKHGFGLVSQAKHVWMTGSSAPDYYENHPEAKQKKRLALAAYDEIKLFMKAASKTDKDLVKTMIEVNNPNRTKVCVDYLRSLGKKTHYVSRGINVSRKHPFSEAKLKVLAPEKDTSVYYGHFHPLSLGVLDRSGGPKEIKAAKPLPPAGVDAGSFFDLIESRKYSYFDNMLTIDKAANNTSIVFTIEWRGNRLLFAADAEIKSWEMMKKKRQLGPVNFLKISHHGSHNGTPSDEILNELLPRRGKKKRRAILSTMAGQYNQVPDSPTIDRIAERCQVKSTAEIPDGDYIDYYFT